MQGCRGIGEGRQGSVHVLALLAALVAFMLIGPQAAGAQDAYPGGYTLMPLDPGPVRLLSMMVDASIHDDGAQAFADVQAVFRVHNTDENQARVLRVAFPGYAVEDPPPESFSLKADGRDITLSRGQQQWWVADVPVGADERANLVLNYSAPLGEGPFVRFRYPLDLTANLWPGRLESVRFTLSFPDPPNPQSWLQLTPATYKQTAESLTWSYDTVDPEAPIDYLLMRPALWQQLRAARQAAVAPGAPALSQVALGDIYTRLATGADDPAIFDRYFPLAVAAYHQAQTLAPGESAPYLALADLYRHRAARSEPPDPVFSSLATEQLAAALENGVQDPDMARQVAAEYAVLVATARQNGDFATANTYLQRLQTLAGSSQLPMETEAVTAERRQLAIDWAAAVLNEQGPAAARKVLEQAVGDGYLAVENPPGAEVASVLALPDVPTAFARVQSLQASIDTQPGLRRMQLAISPREGGEALVQRLYDSLAASGAATVTLASTQPPVLQVEIPFADGEELRRRQGTLASAIDPADPEWAGVSALLQPQGITWTQTDERWRALNVYDETVTLATARETYERQAQALEAAADGVDSSHPLYAVLPALLRAEAEVWRQLGDNQGARFTLTLYPRPGAPLLRSWALQPGGAVEMSAQATQYRLERFVWAAAGVWLVALALAAIAWWGFRR